MGARAPVEHARTIARACVRCSGRCGMWTQEYEGLKEGGEDGGGPEQRAAESSRAAGAASIPWGSVHSMSSMGRGGRAETCTDRARALNAQRAHTTQGGTWTGWWGRALQAVLAGRERRHYSLTPARSSYARTPHAVRNPTTSTTRTQTHLHGVSPHARPFPSLLSTCALVVGAAAWSLPLSPGASDANGSNAMRSSLAARVCVVAVDVAVAVSAAVPASAVVSFAAPAGAAAAAAAAASGACVGCSDMAMAACRAALTPGAAATGPSEVELTLTSGLSAMTGPQVAGPDG